MEMIRQNHMCVDAEWQMAFGPENGVPEPHNVFSEQLGPALKQVHCEKVRAAGNEDASIIGHRQRMAEQGG